MIEKRIFENCDDYTVTNDGKVFSYKRGKRKELSQARVSRDKRYKAVCLWVNGKGKPFYVHRLVAGSFIPNPNNLPQVNHKDRNTNNNHVENLEWVTSQGNKVHAYATDEYKECMICGKRIYVKKHSFCSKCRTHVINTVESCFLRGKADKSPLSTKSRPTEAQKKAIALIAQGYNQAETARKLNVSRQYINEIVKSCFVQ